MDTPDQLIRAARDGDREALGRLLVGAAGELRAVAERRLGPRLRARAGVSDVLQQTSLEAQRDFGAFAGDSREQLLAWLTRILERNVAEIARRHALARRRAVDRERSLDDSDDDAVADLAASDSSPSQRAMRGESALRLARALAQLPEDQRAAVRLRHIEGRSLADIAERLERSTVAAASLLKRGIRNLGTLLDERDTP